MIKFNINEKKKISSFFKKNGYVIIKNIFSKKELSNAESELKHVVNAHLNKAQIKKRKSLSDTIMHLEKKNHKFIKSIYDTIFQTPSFMQLLSNKKINYLTNFLINNKQKKKSVYLFTNRLRIDPPQDSRRLYSWHQEVFYTVPKTKVIQLWAPFLKNSSDKLGSIQIIPGSHLKGIMKQNWNKEVKGKSTQIIIDSNEISIENRKSVNIKIGEACFFDYRLAHRSGVNESKHIRFSLISQYLDINSKDFYAPQINYKFNHILPEKFYNEYFKNEKRYR